MILCFFITDHLGTPSQMYSKEGTLFWEGMLDSYGRMRMEKGDSGSCPFRYQGQYEDKETGLYYNRFRYYAPDEGSYISQDPICLQSGTLCLYNYVYNTTAQVDIFGLSIDPVIYEETLKTNYPLFEIRQPISNYVNQADKWVDKAIAAVKNNESVVLGDLKHTGTFIKKNPTSYHRLFAMPWTPLTNDHWMQALIDNKADFTLVSPLTKNFLESTEYGKSVYGREIDMLIKAGYKIPLGKEDISPDQPYILNALKCPNCGDII